MQNCECDCVCECKCDHDLVLRIIDKILDHKISENDSCDHHCHWEKGSVHLSTGRHEVFIRTQSQPINVFICSHSTHQVCGAEVDLFAAQVASGGFVLLADVKNDHVKVEWMASVKPSEII